LESDAILLFQHRSLAGSYDSQEEEVTGTIKKKKYG